MAAFRLALLVVLASVLSLPSYAQQAGQGAMIQGGAVTRGHAPVAIQAGGPGANIYGDGGTAFDGQFTEFGITNTGTPFCINNVPRTTPGGYYELCFGANAAGQGLLTYNSYNTATPLPFNCVINGVVIPDCLTAGAGILTPPVVVTDNKSGPITPSLEGAAITAKSEPGITAQQIADWIFCNLCTTPVSYDALRSVALAPPGQTIDLVNAIGGYVVSQSAIGSISPAFPTSVALFGMGLADANGTAVWGINTALSDNRGQFVSSGTGRALYNEFDLNFTSPSSIGTGLILGGHSVVQPANATGITLATLDQNNGLTAKWGQFLFSFDGATTTFETIGAAAATGASVIGQQVNMVYRNSSNTRQFITYNSNTTGGIVFENTESTPVFLIGVGVDTRSPSTTQDIIQIGLHGSSVSPSLSSQRETFAYTDTGGTQQEVALEALGGNTPTLALSSSTGPIYLSVGTALIVGGVTGLSCSGTPSSSFASVGGIVTHC